MNLRKTQDQLNKKTQFLNVNVNIVIAIIIIIIIIIIIKQLFNMP